MLNDISIWSADVLEERSSSYVSLSVKYISFNYKTFHLFSMVNSFETVVNSLVKEEDFMEFSFTRDQLTVSAAVVCHRYIVVANCLISHITQ